MRYQTEFKPELLQFQAQGTDRESLEMEQFEYLESEVDRSSPEYIRWVQDSLNKILGLRLKVDGIIGPQTRSAIRSFQQRQGLAVDGIVGPNTERALQLALGQPTSPPTAATCNPYQSAFERAAKYVGVPSTWATNPSLCQLVKHESAWKPSAKNPSSSAFGLFQFLTSTWKKFLPEVPYGNTDPYWQAVGGFRYIQAAYRTPERAWAFWQATVYRNPSLAPPDLRKKVEDWIAKGWGGYEV